MTENSRDNSSTDDDSTDTRATGSDASGREETALRGQPRRTDGGHPPAADGLEGIAAAVNRLGDRFNAHDVTASYHDGEVSVTLRRPGDGDDAFADAVSWATHVVESIDDAPGLSVERSVEEAQYDPEERGMTDEPVATVTVRAE